MDTPYDVERELKRIQHVADHASDVWMASMVQFASDVAISRILEELQDDHPTGPLQ